MHFIIPNAPTSPITWSRRFHALFPSYVMWSVRQTYRRWSVLEGLALLPAIFLSALFRANLICSVCYVAHATPSTTASFALQSVFARMQRCKHKSAGDVLRVAVGCRRPWGLAELKMKVMAVMLQVVPGQTGKTSDLWILACRGCRQPCGYSLSLWRWHSDPAMSPRSACSSEGTLNVGTDPGCINISQWSCNCHVAKAVIPDQFSASWMRARRFA